MKEIKKFRTIDLENALEIDYARLGLNGYKTQVYAYVFMNIKYCMRLIDTCFVTFN